MQTHSDQRSLLLLGSTGSIGTQALDVVRRNPARFRVAGIAAAGADPAVVAAQALEFDVGAVAVARGRVAEDLQLACYAEAQRRGYHRGEYRIPRILVGPQAATEL
ncbi:MAG: 1-deoxy-D-xylulose-5-phosphate reductoisomerase, partial [Actinomycetota bacterium]|nr:1-deoxy-D-xylulose-5-phosphate reductoisomerase [Actinomycetota bacterium]